MTDDRHSAPSKHSRTGSKLARSNFLQAFVLLAAVLTLTACTSSTRRATSSGPPTIAVSAATSANSATATGSSASDQAGHGGAVVAVDERTGRQRWRTVLPMATVSEPVVGGALVVVAGVDDCNTSNLFVVALDATTGRIVWQRTVATEDPCGAGATLRLAADVVIAGGPSGGGRGGRPDASGACNKPVAPRSTASALDFATGAPRWRAPLAAGEILAAGADIVIANGTSPGCLVGLDPVSGQLHWTVAPSVVPFDVSVIGHTAYQIAGGPEPVTATASDPGTGKTRWQVHLPFSSAGGGVFPLVVGDVIVAQGSLDTQSPSGTSVPALALVGLAPADGRQLWRTGEHDSQNWVTMGPGLLIVTHLHGLDASTLESLDLRTGARRWQSPNIGGIGIPRTDGTVVVTYSPTSARGFRGIDGHPLWSVPGAYQAAAVSAGAVYLAAPEPPRNPPGGG